MKYFIISIFIGIVSLISGCIKFETERYNCLISPIFISIEDHKVSKIRRLEEENYRLRNSKDRRKVIIVNNK